MVNIKYNSWKILTCTILLDLCDYLSSVKVQIFGEGQKNLQKSPSKYLVRSSWSIFTSAQKVFSLTYLIRPVYLFQKKNHQPAHLPFIRQVRVLRENQWKRLFGNYRVFVNGGFTVKVKIMKKNHLSGSSYGYLLIFYFSLTAQSFIKIRQTW